MNVLRLLNRHENQNKAFIRARLYIYNITSLIARKNNGTNIMHLEAGEGAPLSFVIFLRKISELHIYIFKEQTLRADLKHFSQAKFKNSCEIVRLFQLLGMCCLARLYLLLFIKIFFYFGRLVRSVGAGKCIIQLEMTETELNTQTNLLVKNGSIVMIRV